MLCSRTNLKWPDSPGGLLGPEPIHFRPECVEIQPEPLTPGNIEVAAPRVESVAIRAVAHEFENFQRAGLRIHKPIKRHAKTRVFAELLDAIPTPIFRTSRHHFHGDVGSVVHGALSRWHPPARKKDGQIGFSSAL